MKHTVLPARPYKPGNLGSMGKASSMIIRQYQFPNEYQEHEKLEFSDHDRCIKADYNKATACIRKHTLGTAMLLEFWFLRANDKEIMAFLQEFLDASNEVIWTGYRIRVTINQREGVPIWSLELFAQTPGSNTVVYTGTKDVPNVYDY